MTDEEWAMVQKTPEYAAARQSHAELTLKLSRKLINKHVRIEQAMCERHEREHKIRRQKRDEERKKLDELLFEKENESLRKVYAKYGLKEGREQ
jgi:hypothetical protein